MREKSPQIIQKTKAVRFPTAPLSDLYIFKVQNITAVNGVYNCFKQLTFGVFDTVFTEVLNLLESYTVEDYTPALAIGDWMAAFQTPDENGIMRWVGFPLISCVRMARTVEGAPASKQITCNLMVNDEEITEGLGSNISVNCSITRDIAFSEYNLNAASPRFGNGDYLFPVNLSGKWHLVTVCQVSEYCACNQV